MTDQTCPSCLLTEAAGPYCTRCLTRTGADYWHPAERTPAQDAAAKRLAALRSKERRGEVSETEQRALWGDR
jgi:hypothetical protein